MDGKTVQYWEAGYRVWIDLEPPNVSELIRPEADPFKWRIKPESSTKRQKVALMETDNGGKELSIEDEFFWQLIEDDTMFIEWVTGPYEVEDVK